MKFNNSIKYAIAFCFIALMSSNTSAQSTAAGELIFNGDFNRSNTGVPFTAARPDVDYPPLPWTVINGSVGSTRLATDIEIGMPLFLDPNIVQRADLPGFESSPVGGSFVGMNATNGLHQQIRFFGTSTDDSALPDSITIEFYYTEYNKNTDTTDTTPGFPSPSVDLEITLNEFGFGYSALLYEVPNLFSTGGTPGTWEKRSVTFSTANAFITDSRTNYKFSIVCRGTNVNDYVFIDGVSARASGLVDTDGDGITDVNEPGTQNDPCLPAQAAGYTGFDAANPLWQAADCDGDGVNNGQEVIDGTDPYSPSSCGGDGPILIQN